jgi:hypothetical protein
MYWHMRDLWGPTNLIVMMVAEFDDTPPYFTDVQWDSVRATHGVSTEAYTWKMALGYGGPLMVPSWEGRGVV